MSDPKTLAAVILAAGASTRLGRPKQLVLLGEERLLERAIRVAREAECVPIVVLGHALEEIRAACNLSECHIVANPDWHEGMGSSIRVGIEAAQQLSMDAAIIMTCDQPAVTGEHLKRLITTGHKERIVASAYAGRRGVPAYFPASSFPLLLELHGDAGARELLTHAQAVDLLLGELDVDTEEKLTLARASFSNKNSTQQP